MVRRSVLFKGFGSTNLPNEPVRLESEHVTRAGPHKPGPSGGFQPLVESRSVMEEPEKPPVRVDTLYAVGDRDTKELHFHYGTDVLLSDDKQKLLGIIRAVFGTGSDDEVVEVTVEELRSLIHTQWNSSKRLSVTIESDTMEKAARWALEDYLTTPPPLGVSG